MIKRLFFILLYLQLAFPAIIWAELEIRNPFIPQLPKETISKELELVPSLPKPKPRPDPGKIPEGKEGRDAEKQIPEDLQPPELNIKGLIWNSNRPQAIINDQVVDLGDTVSEAEIVSIQKNEIGILFKGQKITIKP